MAIKGHALVTLVESDGVVGACYKLNQALEAGRRGDLVNGVKAEEFSLREMAQSFMGYEWVSRLSPKKSGGFVLLEAGEAVDVSAFSSITGQIVYSKILDGWQQASTGVDQLIDVVSSSLDGEKFPWIGQIVDEGEEVKPGMNYPETGFGEQYIETPSTKKNGAIVSVTKEAIFFDLTSQVLRVAGQIGERIATKRDKSIYNVIFGGTNTFKWNGTQYNTYQAAGAFWSNLIYSNPMIDWTSFNKAELAFSNMLDPVTKNPIEVKPTAVLVPKALLHTTRQILGATSIQRIFPGYSQANVAAPGNVITQSANSLDNYSVISSNYVRHQLKALGLSDAVADGSWLFGNFKKAFAYVENWPLAVVQAPALSEAEFERDIVTRFKASYRGVPAIMDPFQIVWNRPDAAP